MKPIQNASFARILIAIDHTEHAASTLKYGIELAKKLGSRVKVVHVLEPLPAVSLEYTTIEFEQARSDKALEWLELAKQQFPPNLRVETAKRDGLPAEQVLEAAKQWQANLLVIGTHSKGRLARIVLGSTADKIVRHAPCPVLIVSHDCETIDAKTEWVGVGSDCADPITAHEDELVQ